MCTYGIARLNLDQNTTFNVVFPLFYALSYETWNQLFLFCQIHYNVFVIVTWKLGMNKNCSLGLLVYTCTTTIHEQTQSNQTENQNFNSYLVGCYIYFIGKPFSLIY
jgi:hypothetical protein